MSKNPCLSCRMIDEDKNNPTCRQCDMRVRYVAQLENSLAFCWSSKGRHAVARCSLPLGQVSRLAFTTLD